ncbi:hypothetical protein LY90DRAFT_703212 [Neocallimastix californiae]|jgi:hypothetical protein|uniref:CBM10 domain-containing protein n=1 Tax=Neocallimastix californiae TaxID=1754190 RepID=A0A1Y2CLQ9_9FUNG|nr:hypothetical protein LY90DRAFT_703212 [Neocallimastix californiae]|eukprot:ORY47951.1 hypothetical protein LY90DRAFT_703212 [Neocallimastix californiae]
MKFNKIFSTLGLLTASLVSASRSDFYGSEDNRPKLFQILDDHVGTIKVNLESEVWENMKKKSVLEPWNAGEVGEKYGSENATLEFYVDGTDYRVELKPGQFSFKLGGKITRNFAKPGYNIKINDGNIFDVKLLRLRSGIRDVSFMREKICSDIVYKMGLLSTSTNYVNVEVNGENLGIFILTNKIKKDFIKRHFGEKSTNNLYECKKDFSRFEDNSIVTNCENAKEELINDKDDLQKFVDAVNNAKSVDDLRQFLDVDTFIRTLAFEFVTLSWDHFMGLSHNYFWYKRTDGIWTIILNDFDETLGADVWPSIFQGDGDYVKKYVDKSYIIDDVTIINFPNCSVHDCEMGHKIVKLVIHDNEEQWREVIGDVVKNVYNPTFINKRIDEIKELIQDDLAVSRAIDETTGVSLGCFNSAGFYPKWNMTQFETGVNNVGWQANTGQSRCYGLKYFIEKRFDYLCHTYGINPETLELIQPRPAVSYWGIINKYPFDYGNFKLYEDEFVKFTYPNLDKEDFMQESYNADPIKNANPPYEMAPFLYDVYEQPEQPTATTAVDTPVETDAPAATDAPENCWSEVLGYPCCTSSCHVYSTDSDGQWGYEDDHWCGIADSCAKETCWSKKFGYGCCEGCRAYEEDADGKWGYENNEWCGIVEQNCQ